MKELLKKFGVDKDIELNFCEYVKAGGYLPEKDFNRIFLAPKKEEKPARKKRTRKKK